jgi:cysteine desulfurase
MIYFDNNATTAVAPEVFDAMKPFLAASYGNPSSSHEKGRESRKAVGAARASVASLIGAVDPSEIVFTSCGTESDNWAILGALRLNPAKRHIITTRVEHEAVRNLCENLAREGYEITFLDVDEEGSLDVDSLRRDLRKDTAVVSIMLANNETGVLFPVSQIAEIVKSNSDALFHVDGVNAVGKVQLSLKETGIDLFSLSGHKFHAPKGIGALYIRDGVALPPFLVGGGQENGRRAGTEAVHQIAGLGRASEMVKDPSTMDRVRALRDKLENEILKRIPNSRLNGTSDADKRLPNTSNISFSNTNGEMILAKLNDAGICVSTGSACNSESHVSSPVLRAMNVPYRDAMGSIRFSLGRYNTDDDVERVLDVLPGIVAELHAMAA